jgi:ATP-dependent Clp protease ATP-binding subunit ClpB
LNPQGNTVGCTPLHYAALISNEKIIDLLIKHGADCTLLDEAGHSAQEFLDHTSDVELKEKLDRLCELKMAQKLALEKEYRRKCHLVYFLGHGHAELTHFLVPLEKKLKEAIVGQEGPINEVASAIRRKENGWHDEEHPLVFLFLGSSGIGKTELAKQLAKYLHKGDKNAFIRYSKAHVCLNVEMIVVYILV